MSTIETFKIGIDMTIQMGTEILDLIAASPVQEEREILKRIQHDFLGGQDYIIYATYEDWQIIIDRLILTGDQNFAKALMEVIA